MLPPVRRGKRRAFREGENVGEDEQARGGGGEVFDVWREGGWVR